MYGLPRRCSGSRVTTPPANALGLELLAEAAAAAPRREVHFAVLERSGWQSPSPQPLSWAAILEEDLPGDNLLPTYQQQPRPGERVMSRVDWDPYPQTRRSNNPFSPPPRGDLPQPFTYTDHRDSSRDPTLKRN